MWQKGLGLEMYLETAAKNEARTVAGGRLSDRVRVFFLKTLFAASVGLGLLCYQDYALGSTQGGAPGRSTPVKTPNTLIIGTTQETDTLHPTLTGMAASAFVRAMVLRPVMAADDRMVNECLLCDELPSLANGRVRIVKETDKAGSGEKMYVTWKLKPGIRWGDGTPVTGEDFKLGWEVGSAAHISVSEADAFRAIEDVRVDPKDPLTFTLKYGTTRYDFDSIELMEPIPAHLERAIFEQTKSQPGGYEKKTLYNTQPTHPGLYNGPYRVKEYQPGAHILLERNPQYFGKQAQFPQVMYKLIPNTQTLEAEFKIGAIHMTAHTGVSMDQALQFEKQMERSPQLARQFRVAYGRIPSYEKIDFNLQDPLVGDVRVRQALALSLDRHRLTKALFAGKQDVADQIFHPLSSYYSAKLPPIAYDPERARQLLDAAGWRLGSKGIREKEGKPLSLLMMTTSQNKMRELIQTYAQEEWRKVGIQVQFKNEPARVFFGETVRKMAYGSMALYGWTEDIPHQVPIHLYHSKYVPSKENKFIGYNRTGVQSPEIDRILDGAVKTLDKDKRSQMLQEFSQIFRDLMVELPLFYRTLPFLVSRQLVTPTTGPGGFPRALTVETWQWVAP